MQTLSFTQEYYLCAVNSRWKTPGMQSMEVQACLLVSGMLELLYEGYLRRDEQDNLRTAREWDDRLPYLKPLYEATVGMKKPRSLKGVASHLMREFNQKPFNEYFTALGASLVESGDAERQSRKGFFRETVRCVPKQETIKRIVKRIRTEVLDDGVITEETICLVAFFDKSGLLRDYFSKFEAKDLKARLKEIKTQEPYSTIKKVIDDIEALYAVFITVFILIFAH